MLREELYPDLGVIQLEGQLYLCDPISSILDDMEPELANFLRKPKVSHNG